MGSKLSSALHQITLYIRKPYKGSPLYILSRERGGERGEREYLHAYTHVGLYGFELNSQFWVRIKPSTNKPVPQI